MDYGCSMRAVKNNLPTPSGEVGNQKVLVRRAQSRISQATPENEMGNWEMRAGGIISATPYKRDSSLRPCLGQGASLGEEAVLADSGRAGEVAARVGRVRILAFLSILL